MWKFEQIMANAKKEVKNGAYGNQEIYYYYLSLLKNSDVTILGWNEAKQSLKALFGVEQWKIYTDMESQHIL